MNLSFLKLSTSEIEEINRIDFFYRNTNLEQFAKHYEEVIINGEHNLFPYIIFGQELTYFKEVKRVSINKTIRTDKSNNRLYGICDLKYPPKSVLDYIGYNRVNYKKQSIFYGGFGNFQALFENPPLTGDLFTISTWKQKDNQQLCYVPIFHDIIVQERTNAFKKDWDNYLIKLEKLDDRTKSAAKKLLSLYTYFFIRPVNPLKKIEYIFSAFIANKIFEINYEPKVEAILYPSVPMGGISSNLAILPESFELKFDFVRAEEYIVLNKTDNKNQWFYTMTASSVDVHNNLIMWSNETLDNNTLNFLKMYGVDYKQ